jgi:hypothetical protein
VIVQDPDDATVPSMPESALRAVAQPDAVLSATAIGKALSEPRDGRARMREDTAMPAEIGPVEQGPERPSGPPSSFTCPE